METLNKWLRLSQFEIGQHWLCIDAMRVARVVDRETIEVVSEGKIEARPALRVKVTLPTFPIAGHVNQKQAKANKEILKSIEAQAATDQVDVADTEWEEIWSERLTYRMESYQGMVVPDRNAEGPTQPQLYVHVEIGKLKTRQGQMKGKSVRAILLDEAVVKFPNNLFRGEGRKAKETENAQGDGAGVEAASE